MKKIFLTCEHGGAQIPASYNNLFSKNKRILKTHRALDIGALDIAKDLKYFLGVPLEFSIVSRLLIDLNRFLNSPKLFSEYSNHLTSVEKNRIIRSYYEPHWKKITRKITSLSSKNNQVIHVAVHSMTDQLNKKKRHMHISLLYDPRRKSERRFASLWINRMRNEFPNLKFARNNPYKGSGEGLTSSFRKLMKEDNYIGIELEVNQAYLKSFLTTRQRRQFSEKLGRSLKQAVDNFV